jgi:hypothetical protein
MRKIEKLPTAISDFKLFLLRVQLRELFLLLFLNFLVCSVHDEVPLNKVRSIRYYISYIYY